jgi:HlyD family secretion protein
MKAKLEQAERDWKRAQKLGPSDALAQVDYDAYESAYESAKANVGVGDAALEQAKATVTQNEAAVKRAKQNLEYCTVSSPVDGVIIARRVNIGQTVVSSLSAPSLFLIAKDLTHEQIWVQVNEADIGHVKPGQNVTFSVDAYPDRKFKGTVTKVRMDAQNTQNVVTYTVEITTDNADRALFPYMSANVSFEVAKRENALMVPNVALRWSPSNEDVIAPDAREQMASASNETGGGGGRSMGEKAAGGGETGAGPTSRPTTRRTRGSGMGGGSGMPQHGTVWIVDGTYVRPLRVRLGITDNINTEISGGELKEGDAVVTGDAVAGDVAGGDDAKNPFAPQFRGGRSGRGGGGRR